MEFQGRETSKTTFFVSLMKSDTGAFAQNQFDITINGKKAFQSYKSPIAIQEDGYIRLSPEWERSRTTSRYFYRWLKINCWTIYNRLDLAGTNKRDKILKGIREGIFVIDENFSGEEESQFFTF